MWVDESLRGLARVLVAGAEREAQRRGRALVVFHAYDLLAPGLYERLGYETVGVIEGYPAGSAARWHRKPVTPALRIGATRLRRQPAGGRPAAVTPPR